MRFVSIGTAKSIGVEYPNPRRKGETIWPVPHFRIGLGLVEFHVSLYEFYDLERDPSELENLSGQARVAGDEQRLREALAEQMILDWDYLPLPAMLNEK